MARCSECLGSGLLWAKRLLLWAKRCLLCDGQGRLGDVEGRIWGFCPDDVEFMQRRCKEAVVGDGRRPVVLVATGTYAPPHRGHFEMLTAAESALTANGGCVVGAIMVPSSSEFAGDKEAEGWEIGLSYEVRKSLLLKMAEDLRMADWLHVSDAQEVLQLHYFQVLEGMAEGLAGSGSSPALVMVHGGDRHFSRLEHEAPLFKPLLDTPGVSKDPDSPGPNCAGIVVVPRPGPLPLYLEGKSREEWPEVARASPLRAVAQALSSGRDDFSSTLLRKEVFSALPDAAAAVKVASDWMTDDSAKMYVDAVKMQ